MPKRELVLLFVGQTYAVRVDSPEEEELLRKEMQEILDGMYSTPPRNSSVKLRHFSFGTTCFIGFYFRDAGTGLEAKQKAYIDTVLQDANRGEEWRG